MKLDRNIQYFVNEELGLGMYVLPAIGFKDLFYNYNDLCDMLVLIEAKRKNWLRQLPEDIHYKIKVEFERGDDGLSNETFISTPALIEVLNRYGQELLNMLERKNSVENFIYEISRKFENEYVENNEISMGDKFVLGSLSYDAEFTNRANKNLLNLLKKNDTMETLWKFRPDINMDKEDIELKKQAEQLIKLMNETCEGINLFQENVKTKIPEWLPNIIKQGDPNSLTNNDFEDEE